MTPDLSIVSKHSVEKRIAANTGLLVSAKALAAIIGLFTLIITERALDDQISFGTILFLHAYMLFFAEVATFQSWQSLIRFGTDDVRDKDVSAFSKLIRFTIALDCISAVLAFIAAISLFGLVTFVMMRFPDIFPQSEALDPKDLQMMVCLYSTVVLTKQTGTATGVLRLFDKFVGLAFSALAMPVVRFIGAVTAYKLGWGITGFILVWYLSALVGNLVVIFLGLYELMSRKCMGAILASKADFMRPREGLWSFVWKSNIDSTLAAGTSHLPILLVMAVFGPAFLAIYRIAEEISKLLSEGVKLLDQVIYPELARIISEGQAHKIWVLVRRAAIIALCVGLGVSIFVSLVGPFAIRGTLGPEYGQAVILSILLVLGAAIFAAVAPLYPVFYAADRPERAIYARVTGLAIYIIAFFVLTRFFGGLGAAWAVIAGHVIGLAVVTILAKKTLEQAVAKAAKAGVS